MANTIKIKQSAVTSKIPTAAQLEQGELAVNTADEKIYSKNSSGVVFELGQNAGTLVGEDNRTISPNEVATGRLKVGFTSWANNNTGPYADFFHFRSYGDSSGGNDNLLMLKKGGTGLRLWQQTFGSTTAYANYVDFWNTGNDGSGSGLDADLLDGKQGSEYSLAHSHPYLPIAGKAADSNLLDGIDSSQFLRSDADDMISGNIGWSNGKSFYINGSGGGRVPYPAGGSYFTSTGTVTGALKIKLPTASKGLSDMISFEVNIFDYTANESVKLLINAYQYSSANWTNHTVVILTGNPGKDYTVRFGSDATSHCLWIAETSSTWSYPQVSVSNFTCGFSASAVNYVDGWAVTFVTSFDTVQDTVTTNLPVPQIANDSINSQHYAAGSIDNEHIADNAINSEHYADGSIDRVHLAADVIDSTKLANDSVNSEHYVNGSIDAAHIGNDQVNSQHYAAGSIDNEHIADNAINSCY